MALLPRLTFGASINYADTVAPTVTGVSSTKANGTYGTGEVIDIQVTCSKTVVVTGTPQLTLAMDGTDRTADFLSVSGAVMTFRYTVQSGDATSDLDYASTSALALNSGTIKSTTGVNATLTLPSPGASGSLGNNKAIVIATTAPVLVSATIPSAGTSLSILLNGVVTFGAGGNGGFGITMSGGAVTLTYSSGSGSNTLVYTTSRTIASGETCSSFSYSQPGNGVEDGSGNDLATFAGQQASVTNSSTAGGSSTTFVTAYGGTGIGAPAGDSTQEHGIKFTVGASDIDVTELGGRRGSGTTYANYPVRLRNNAGTLLAEVTIDYDAVSAGSVSYTSVGSPVTLTAGGVYHLTAGNDSYNGPNVTPNIAEFTTTSAATINSVTNESQSTADGFAAYVDFKYT